MSTKMEVHGCDGQLDLEKFKHAMGMGSGRMMKGRLLRLAREVMERVVQVAQPKFIMETGSSEAFETLSAACRRIQIYLKKTTGAALVVATAGEEVTRLANDYRNEGDVFCQYLVQCAGTVLVRDCLIDATRMLADRYPNHRPGPHLSPGNAGVPLELQSLLVRRLPLKKINVNFVQETNLLSPLASMSALIGIGSFKALKGTSCSRCSSQACALREAPFQPSLLWELPWSA